MFPPSYVKHLDPKSLIETVSKWCGVHNGIWFRRQNITSVIEEHERKRSRCLLISPPVRLGKTVAERRGISAICWDARSEHRNATCLHRVTERQDRLGRSKCLAGNCSGSSWFHKLDVFRQNSSTVTWFWASPISKAGVNGVDWIDDGLGCGPVRAIRIRIFYSPD